MNQEIDRQLLRLMASGKYLDLNKSYDALAHQQFVDGALFTFDYMTKKERDTKITTKLTGVPNEPMAIETMD